MTEQHHPLEGATDGNQGPSANPRLQLDVEQHLYGLSEPLSPAELRRAALLRLIGLGRFAGSAGRSPDAP